MEKQRVTWKVDRHRCGRDDDRHAPGRTQCERRDGPASDQRLARLLRHADQSLSEVSSGAQVPQEPGRSLYARRQSLLDGEEMLRILEVFAGTLVRQGLGVGSDGASSTARRSFAAPAAWPTVVAEEGRTQSNDVEKRSMQRSLMLSIAAVAFAAVLSGSPAGLARAQTQTPVDGRIVRVVYQVGGAPGAVNPTWGFHMAHMKDGRYCVRLGNPGRRLSLAIIDEVVDICFDRVPATVDLSPERRYQAIDTSDGREKTFLRFHKGSIGATGDAITLDVTSCRGAEGVPERCFPSRYIVHISEKLPHVLRSASVRLRGMAGFAMRRLDPR
jgi:hypothetical protein